MIVQSVAVDVIHSIIDRRIRILAKSLCDDAADKPVSRLPEAAKANALIAFVVDEGFENARLGVFEALDAPARADKIARIALDRPPFFIRKILYKVHIFISFFGFY